MGKKKEYATRTVGTIWINTNKKTKEEFVSVSLVEPKDEKGKENKYFKGTLFFQDEESGSLYKINKFKTFENDNHDAILANLCVELNDEDYAELVTDED